MSQKVMQRRFGPGAGLEKLLAAVKDTGAAPASTAGSHENLTKAELEVLLAEGGGFTFASFTVEDALELGQLLHARLHPFATAGRPTVISISLANSTQVLYHIVTGPGTSPDNESWVRRKRASVLRFGVSTWALHHKYKGDEAAFAAKFALGPEQAGAYAIHGGGVPIRVKGVEGVVAVVVVSGLKQHEDHGIISEVIHANWQ